VEHDATALAQRVRDREVTPAELLECAIALVETLNPRINAVVRRMFDVARAAVAAGLPVGPFSGVPFLLKDLGAHVAGVPTAGGSRLLEQVIRTHDSEIVRRYRAAGVVILGKTNTPELGILGVTENDRFGPTRSPWDLDRTPGGSSGGSGAAVAARIVPVAHGGDGGGSIRIPSSACGLVGLKPSRGRSPIGPDGDIGWSGFVEQHVLTRSVRDSAAFLDVIAGDEPGRPVHARPPERPFAQEVGRDPGRLRVAFTTGALLAEDTHPECVAAVESAARTLEDLGHEVVEESPPLDRPRLVRAYLMTVAANVCAEVRGVARTLGRRVRDDELEPTTWLLHDIGRRASAGELRELHGEMVAARWELHRFHERYDVWVTPTMAQPPARIGEFSPKPAERAVMWLLRRVPIRLLLERALQEMADGMLAAMPNTEPLNMTGQPAMSLPLHMSDDGLPIGVQLVARLGDEATLFRLAAQLEAARPWADRRPPLLAHLGITS
jgi:amidase